MIAPAAERNKQPILEALKSLVSSTGKLSALEVASGTGQHVTHFAKHFQNIAWQPTDIDGPSLQSIAKTIATEQTSNVNGPLELDISRPLSEWPSSIRQTHWDVILCSNMIHIAPWSCTEGLFNSAGQLLASSGLLITYGPYAVNGSLVPESNVKFDQSLRQRNPEWGVRDTKDLKLLASFNHLRLDQMIEMPANNKILVFKRNETQ